MSKKRSQRVKSAVDRTSSVLKCVSEAIAVTAPKLSSPKTAGYIVRLIESKESRCCRLPSEAHIGRYLTTFGA